MSVCRCVNVRVRVYVCVCVCVCMRKRYFVAIELIMFYRLEFIALRKRNGTFKKNSENPITWE